MDPVEKKLNKEQLKAVRHGSGSLLVIAGAGTGKTTVITERIKYLISEGLATPEEILALTFTEKASQEMEERIDIAMPLSYGEMWIMTFHGFCDRILRDNALHIGLPSNYKLMTEAESIDLIRRNMFEFDLDYFRPLGNPNKFIDGLLKHFSRLQDETITPDEYVEFAKKYKNEEKLEIKKTEELANAYKAYDQLKIKEGKFDFGDLITKTLQLFKDRPNILKIYQNKFKYILIDEFQDTNYAQNRLSMLLAGKNNNITVVGDDNQSIYRFRGASVSNILQFKDNYPGVKVITINKNYRSSQSILDTAYKLIKHNDPDTLEIKLGISKKLISQFGNKNNAVEFFHTLTVDDEVEKIVKEINTLKKVNNYEWKDFAILIRANSHADPIIRELEINGIPHQFLGPGKLFEKEEVADLISYLKVLYNVHDTGSFYRLISSDIYDISPLDLVKITNYARRNSLSIFEVLAENYDIKLTKGTKNKISKLFGVIDKHLKLIKKETAGFILYDYIKETGLFEKLLKEEDETKTNNVTKFFEKIKNYEYENKNAGVVALVDYLDLLMEIGESPIVTAMDWQENNAVNVLTVHSSKGLEFKVVFIINLVSLRFPSTERHEQIPIPEQLIKEILPQGNFHLQEERRLFYVGMTRAKEKLYLTASDYYSDTKRAKKVSPFILEALGETALDTNSETKSKKEIYSMKDINQTNKSKKTPVIKIDYLSVSQIETFQICPLHYKLKYIHKLPTEPTAAISFGVSMHGAMRDFYKEIIEGAKPTNKIILKQLQNNWIGEGYKNKKHKDLFLEKGKKYLTEYLENSFDRKILPVMMEEKFNFKLGSNLKIGGTFDRIDRLANDGIEIIDYKTGERVPTQKEVDKDLQLGVYSLAVSKIKSELFGKDPDEIKLSLYYFEGQKKVTTVRTKKDLDLLEKELLEIKNEIEKSDFKCSNHYFCQIGCEFPMFCKRE